MAYFYDAKADVFYNDEVNHITSNMIEVSEDDFIRLIDARNRGCLLFINNTGRIETTTARPTPSHEWNGKDWEIPQEKLTVLFAEQKESLIAQLANKTDTLKEGLLVGYPQTEIDSFYRQEKEALAWQADHNTPTPMLSQIARVRGVPLEMLIEKVIEKSAQFAVAIGIIIGQRQAFEDRLLALKTPQDLIALEQEIEAWTFNAN